MSEKPLDRLNYFNGQRLEAADLKLEQQYHIRVRRWLNKSLYTTGIAQGLEVAADPAQPMNVIVSPGMALDSEGRELILLDQVSIPVVGSSSAMPGIVSGNYLTIQYNEQTTEEEQDGCAIHTGKKGCKCGCGGGNGTSKLAWGGPAIVRAQPILGFTDYLPSDTSGKIVLAQVELDATCKVVSAHPEVRRYVGAASSALVHQFALEGARDFDFRNPQRIYFHIRGRQPNAVTLYLRGELFSTLYYTELGRHNHGLSVAGTLGGPIDATTGQPKPNTATESGASSTDPTPHEHNDLEATFMYNTGTTDNAIFLGPVSGGKSALGVYTDLVASIVGFPSGPIECGGQASYGQANLLDRVKTTSGNGNPDFTAKITGATLHIHGHDHTHAFSFDSGNSAVGYTGVTDIDADNGRPSFSYVADLQVSIDGQDQTAAILTQLQDGRPAQDWTRFGDGTVGHALVADGTQEIKLDFLPNVAFDEGEHVIEFTVTSGGGRILYNLYVE